MLVVRKEEHGNKAWSKLFCKIVTFIYKLYLKLYIKTNVC
jgi:hypothetical protein